MRAQNRAETPGSHAVGNCRLRPQERDRLGIGLVGNALCSPGSGISPLKGRRARLGLRMSDTYTAGFRRALNILIPAFLPVAMLATCSQPKKVRYTGLHTSGNIAYVIGTLESQVCHISCSYQTSTTLPSGYDQAEVLLTGWDVRGLGGASTLRKLRLSARTIRYDPTSGNFDWEAAADVRTAADSGDEFTFMLYLSIVLTKQAGARLAGIRYGCGSPMGGQCHGRILVQNMLPPGWGPVILGVGGFALEASVGSVSSGILVSRLRMDASRWLTSGADFVSYLDCAMHDATPTEPMTCSLDAIALVAARTETFQVHFSTTDTSLTRVGVSEMAAPPGPVDGAFGGLDGFQLSYPGAQQSKTWGWAADYVDIVICPDKIHFCYYRIGFLGDRLGSLTNFLKFAVENKGFGVWTRPP